MKEIRKILVPIDFSDCAMNALKIAASIAKIQRASLEIVHAVQLPKELQVDVMAGMVINTPVLSELETEVEQEFQILENEIPDLLEVTYKTTKSTAPTLDLINSCLEENPIDLIIMGTKGRHNIVDRLLGSISADVIKASNVPVLVIPENFKSFHVFRMGLAADLKRLDDVRKLDLLTLFTEMTKSEIKAFHISQKDDLKNKDEIIQERMKIMDAISKAKHSYVWIDEGELTDGILEFVESHKLDMLVMFPRHHSFWDKIWHPSVTQKVVMDIQIPLLAIPE
jgi:nucleotide-binding universal stress UspA family protein